MAGAEPRKRRIAALVLLALLPLVALGELIAGEIQHRRIPTAENWTAAAMAAVSAQKPGDVIIVAPRWAEGFGRIALNQLAAKPDKLDPYLDVRVAARSDLDVYKRALELSIRGKDDPDVKSWRKVSEQHFGVVSLRTLENPKPQVLVRDLVEEIDSTARVYRTNPLEPCRWEESGSQRMPGLFGGPVAPPNRWLCSPWDPNWSFVGPTVITDLSYMPRRCILMHPTEQPVTVEFPSRPIGHRVVAYIGVHVYLERELKWGPVHATVTVADKEVAAAHHNDGDGWLRFEGSTAEFAGTSQVVKLTTAADPNRSQMRLACMAAQLRD